MADDATRRSEDRSLTTKWEQNVTLRLGDQLPAGWEWRSLGQVVQINPSVNPLPADTPVSFVTMSDVSEDGWIESSSIRPFGEVKNGFSSFQENDVLIAKITPCFENGKGAVATGLTNGVGFGSTEFYVLRAVNGLDPSFLFVHTRAKEFRRYGEANMTGSAGQKRVHSSFLHDWTIPVPPVLEQRSIANIILTWNEAVIHANALRRSLSAMYRALAARHIKLRGDNMRRLGDLLFPDTMETVVPNGPFRALGVRSHGKGTFQRIDDLDALESNKTVYRIEPNRFVVNIVFAWEGAAAITSEEDAGCLVSHRFPTFTIDEAQLNLDYFRHAIRTESFRQLLALASPGGAGRNKTLNRGDLLKFDVHVPSIDEQGSIAATLSALDKRVSVLDCYVEKLTKQRDALASELLTGRIRLPTYVSPERRT